jgi:hypothetical protein
MAVSLRLSADGTSAGRDRYADTRGSSGFGLSATIGAGVVGAGAITWSFPDDDPGHVYVHPIGATHVVRYRLSAEAM